MLVAATSANDDAALEGLWQILEKAQAIPLS